MFSVSPVKRGKISTFTLNLIAIRSIVVSWLPTVTAAIVSLRRSISLECLHYTTEYVQYQRFKVHDSKLNVATTPKDFKSTLQDKCWQYDFTKIWYRTNTSILYTNIKHLFDQRNPSNGY